MGRELVSGARNTTLATTESQSAAIQIERTARTRGTVLLVAFHFPPIRGSSGVQRTLRFAQHLPKFGWRPIVLTIDPRAYDDTASVPGNEIPPDLSVRRAFGLNTARHLSLFGRYPERLALPDRWTSWRLFGVRKGLKIIREEQVDAIWSTFPIASAHSIGLELARRSGLPWIAEFRDPMWQSDWPVEPVANRTWRDLEQRIFARADRAVFTAPSAIAMYAERFADYEPKNLVLIENGYDEETFKRVERARDSNSQERGPRPTVLLHSGIIYRSERDPTHFFAAVASLKAKGVVSAESLQIVLRASGSESDYDAELARLGISDIVRLLPGMNYVAALEEMMAADGLLLLQAANCNAQIPAKLYEYLRAGRPIVALTDPAGDTARTLRAAETGTIARLDSVPEIETALLQFLEQARRGGVGGAPAAVIGRYSRAAQTEQLARLLSECCSE